MAEDWADSKAGELCGSAWLSPNKIAEAIREAFDTGYQKALQDFGVLPNSSVKDILTHFWGSLPAEVRHAINLLVKEAEEAKSGSE